MSCFQKAVIATWLHCTPNICIWIHRLQSGRRSVNFLWTGEANFYLDGSVSTTHSFGVKNFLFDSLSSFHYQKFTVLHEFTAEFIKGEFFSNELMLRGLVTFSISGKSYTSLLKSKIFRYSQTHQCLNSTISMLNGASPRNTTCKKIDFGDILRKEMSPFAIFVMSRLQDPQIWNPVIFWLCSKLKLLANHKTQGHCQNSRKIFSITVWTFPKYALCGHWMCDFVFSNAAF